MLDPFVRGDKEGFKAHNVAEAQRLGGASFGEAMLTTIGCVLLPHLAMNERNIARTGTAAGLAACRQTPIVITRCKKGSYSRKQSYCGDVCCA